MNNSNIINPKLVRDTNTLQFRPFKSALVDQIDVFFGEQRIAILNGLSSPLQWCAKNGSKVPIAVVVELEELVKGWISKSVSQKAEKETFAKTRRELHLLMPEVGESINVFTFAKYMMMSLKHDTITSEEYDMFCGDLKMYCKSKNIETKNEILSLF